MTNAASNYLAARNPHNAIAGHVVTYGNESAQALYILADVYDTLYFGETLGQVSRLLRGSHLKRLRQELSAVDIAEIVFERRRVAALHCRHRLLPSPKQHLQASCHHLGRGAMALQKVSQAIRLGHDGS